MAAIGVFGVILLIPFAWETAEKGIDRENAIIAAKNHFADFQTYGYHRTSAWYDDVVEDQKDPASTVDAANQLQPDAATIVGAGAPLLESGSNIVAGWPYVIDNVGAAQQTIDGLAYERFPLATTYSTADKLPRINRVNFQDVLGNAFDMPLARRIAWQQDDLVFQTPDDELGPPGQAWFSVDDIGTVKRQYDGRYTTISFVVPEDDDRRQYRIYSLVGRAGDRDSERVFELSPPLPGGGDNRGYQGILLGGGDVVLTEAVETIPPAEQRQIRNGDWIMLINYFRADATQDPAVDPMFDDIQLAFYQVLNASPTDINPDEYSVTLQGPDFDVFRDWDDTTGAPAIPTETVTYAVLIPNVLAVYERTFRTEPSSIWVNQ